MDDIDSRQAANRNLAPDVVTRLRQVELLIMDVDGVLTDGAIGYDSQGGEQKRFHAADGLGIVLIHQMGIEVAWISGRQSAIVERRARELGVRHVAQGSRNKRLALLQLFAALNRAPETTAYVGDDWNDLPALRLVGLKIAVANAVREVRDIADYVTERSGGQGAIREICEALMEARQERSACLERYLESLEQPVEPEHAGQ